MGQAKKRREREIASRLAGEREAGLGIQEHSERGRRLWGTNVLQKLLPEGHKPIATRYSPIDGCLHIACEDGSLHKITWQEAEAAESKLYIPTSTERGGKAGQRSECPPSGEKGQEGEAGDDKLPADKAWERVQEQREQIEAEACKCDEKQSEDGEPCPVHGKDGQRGQQQDDKQPDDWTQRWDMAGARYDEWLANGRHAEHATPGEPENCECVGTVYADNNSKHKHKGPCNKAGRKMASGGFFSNGPGFLCDECAIFCVAKFGVAALDSDPEN